MKFYYISQDIYINKIYIRAWFMTALDKMLYNRDFVCFVGKEKIFYLFVKKKLLFLFL